MNAIKLVLVEYIETNGSLPTMPGSARIYSFWFSMQSYGKSHLLYLAIRNVQFVHRGTPVYSQSIARDISDCGY